MVISSSFPNRMSMSSTNRSRNSRWCRSTQNGSDSDRATEPSASWATAAACRIASFAAGTSQRYPSSSTIAARSTKGVGTPPTLSVEAAPRYVPIVRSASCEMSTMQRPVPRFVTRRRSAVDRFEGHPRGLQVLHVGVPDLVVGHASDESGTSSERCQAHCRVRHRTARDEPRSCHDPLDGAWPGPGRSVSSTPWSSPVARAPRPPSSREHRAAGIRSPPGPAQGL